MFGILWGMISVVVLSATGEGFRRGNDKVLRELGKNIGIVWGGRTSLQAGGERAGRQILLTLDDARALARGVVDDRRRQPGARARRASGSRAPTTPRPRASPASSRSIRTSAPSSSSTAATSRWQDEAAGVARRDRRLRHGRAAVRQAQHPRRADHAQRHAATRSSARSARRTRTATTAVPTTTRSSCRSRRWRSDLPRRDAEPGTLSDIIVAPKDWVVDELPRVARRAHRPHRGHRLAARAERPRDSGAPPRLRSRPTRRRSRCGTRRCRR